MYVCEQDVTNVDPLTGAVGDGDPIDVIELGDTPLPMGAVVKVGNIQKTSRRAYCIQVVVMVCLG